MLLAFSTFIIALHVFYFSFPRFQVLNTWYRQPPFHVWGFFAAYNSVSKLGLTSQSVGKAILPETSGHLASKLQNVIRGYPLKMAVIGGSHSAGGGIENIGHAYHSLIENWFEKIVQPNTGSFLEKLQISIGGTGSDFFDFCLANFISNDVDIFLIELSDNDRGTKYGSAVVPMEKLTRRILSLASAPAIIYIEVVGNLGINKYAGKKLNPHCKNLEDYGQNELVSHYGAAAIRWREVVCPLTSTNSRKHKSISELTESKLISKDGLHVGDVGHAQIAYLVISYFQRIFEMLMQNPSPVADSGDGEGSSLIAEEDNASPLPPPLFYNENVYDAVPPLCWTLLSPDFHRGLFPQTLTVKITSNKGFYYIEPNAKRFNSMHSNGRRDSFCGWATGGVSNRIVFGFTVPSPEASSYQSYGYLTQYNQGRSLSVVVRENDVGTDALVWIDDQKKQSKKIKTKRFEGESHVHSVASNVPPGYHQLTVQTTKKGSFQISGIIVGPKQFNGYKYYRV